MLSRLCETMHWPRNSSLIAYKNFHNFHRIRPFFVDDRRYNGGCCLHVQAHNQISLNCLYTSFPTRIGGLSACMGNVVHNTYTTGTRALPDIYARALGPHIRQSTRACGISITCTTFTPQIKG